MSPRSFLEWVTIFNDLRAVVERQVRPFGAPLMNDQSVLPTHLEWLSERPFVRQQLGKVTLFRVRP